MEQNIQKVQGENEKPVILLLSIKLSFSKAASSFRVYPLQIHTPTYSLVSVCFSQMVRHYIHFLLFTQFILVIISYSICSISFLKSGKGCIVYDRSSFSQFLLNSRFPEPQFIFYVYLGVYWINFFVNVPDQWMYAFLMLAILLNCFPQRFMNLYYCQQLICPFPNQHYHNLKINLK